MWKAILALYQGYSDVKKLALKYKLRNIWMSKGKPIITYLSKFTQVWDELVGVGEIVANNDLVSLALLDKSWENFQDAVSGRENLPNWERLWGDCVQEEIRRWTRAGVLVKTNDKENFAFVGKGGKAKGNKTQGKAESSQKGGKKKKDLSKIRCFSCH